MNSTEAKLPSSKSRDVYWVIAILGTATVMYIPTFRYLVVKWMEDAQYSLGFLVPFVSGYFVWKSWAKAATLSRSPSIWGLALIVLGVLLHLAGAVLDVSGPSGFSLILVIVGGCLYLHGAQLTRLLWFPLAYLVFMVPVPGGLIDKVGLPMQLWASGGTAAILRLLHLDVTRAGIQLSVDGDFFEVAPACSGMSSLVALVGVTAVFAYLARLPDRYKLVLFALSVPLALGANIIRITSIALLGYVWNWESAMRFYHEWASPLLFLIAISLLFLINWGFEWLSARRTTS